MFRAEFFLASFTAAFEQLLNLGVGGIGGFVGTVHHSAAVEILVGDGGKRHETELLAHAVLRDHLAGKLGRALDVVGCAGRCDAEDDLLGSSAAQKVCSSTISSSRLERYFFLRRLHRVAERAGGVGDNRDFGYRLRVLLQRRNQRMTDLMIGDNALFHVSQHRALFLGAGDDDLEGNEKVLLVDCLSPPGARHEAPLR